MESKISSRQRLSRLKRTWMTTLPCAAGVTVSATTAPAVDTLSVGVAVLPVVANDAVVTDDTDSVRTENADNKRARYKQPGQGQTSRREAGSRHSAKR